MAGSANGFASAASNRAVTPAGSAGRAPGRGRPDLGIAERGPQRLRPRQWCDPRPLVRCGDASTGAPPRVAAISFARAPSGSPPAGICCSATNVTRTDSASPDAIAPAPVPAAAPAGAGCVVGPDSGVPTKWSTDIASGGAASGTSAGFFCCC